MYASKFKITSLIQFFFSPKIVFPKFQDFNAKLSDFGLAKLGPVDGNSHVTTKVVGTYGYAAPEYMATGSCSILSTINSWKKKL